MFGRNKSIINAFTFYNPIFVAKIASPLLHSVASFHEKLIPFCPSKSKSTIIFVENCFGPFHM